MEQQDFNDLSFTPLTEEQKYAFISRKALSEHFVGYCYREYTELKIDSGWRFLFGDEDQDYLDNPENNVSMNIAEVLQWYPPLEQIISQPRNREFEWDSSSEQFTQL